MERDFLGLHKRQVTQHEHVQEHDDNRFYQQQGFLKNQGGQFGNLVTHNFMPAVDFQKTYRPMAGFLRRNQFCGAFEKANENANANINANANANINANAKQWLLRGVPLTTRNSPYLTMASVSSLPHLTILYGGTATVFNDISPEKVQAIISLAEKSKESNERQEESSCSKMCLKPVATKVFSVSSSSDTQSASVNMNIGNKNTMANFMDLFCADNHAPANIIPSVPQARKASLVRFLEKRNERLMSTMPYNMTNKKLKDCTT